jgi:hypothetical protein
MRMHVEYRYRNAIRQCLRRDASRGPFSDISIIRKDVKSREPSSDTQSCDVVVGVETHRGKIHSSQSLILVDMTSRRRTNQIFMNGNR